MIARQPARSHRRALHTAPAKLTTVALALSLGLSGCSAAPWPHSVDPSPNITIDTSEPDAHAAAKAESFGPPLPYGAYIEPAGSIPARPVVTDRLPAALNPVLDLATLPDYEAPADAEGEVDTVLDTPQERVPAIVRRGRLIVGVDQSHNLLSYRDTATGELAGFEVDIAKEIARDIFGDPEAVDFRFVEYGNRMRSLSEGRVDIIINTMTVTASRAAQVDFSLPYLSTQTRMLVLNGSGISSTEETDGRRLCATQDSTAVQKIREFAPGADILNTASWTDCLMALQLGQTDGIVTDDTLLSGMLVQDPFTSMVGTPMAREVYAVGIRKTDPTAARGSRGDTTGLSRQVNSTIHRIRTDGTWSRLHNQWFGDYLTPLPLPPIQYRPETPVQEQR